MEDLSEALTSSINLSDLQDHLHCSPTNREDCLSADRLFGRTTIASTMSTYDLSPVNSSLRRDHSHREVLRTRDFQASFLRRNLWPKMDYASQYALQKDYSELQKKYEQQLRENEELKRNLKKSASDSKVSCSGCRKEQEKRQATDKALDEAMHLSYTLLKEVKRLDTELVRATSPKRPS